MREWVCLNGKLVQPDQATISVFDSGFMQGIGLFETMRAYHGRVFRLRQHLERLIASARTLGWTAVPELEVLRDHVQQVVGAIEHADARVRLTVTTGSLRPGREEDETPALAIVATATPGMSYPEQIYRNGVTVVVTDYRQNVHDPTTGHKTTSYFARLAALREAHRKGAFEALWFTHANRLAEGCISNVFLVQGERLRTPPLQTPVLPGITRAAVIEAARAHGVEVEEKPLTIHDLLEADEVFLTNSMMEIVPVVRVEREPIGSEKPGELTRRINGWFGEIIERECGDGETGT